jgi:hypothetical protein
MAVSGAWSLCKPTKIGNQFKNISKDDIDTQRDVLTRAKYIWEGSSSVKKYGLHTDGNEFISRLEEATLKDPFLHKFTEGDLVVFKDWMAEFNKGLGKDMGTASAFVDWQLLRYKTKYLPGGQDLANNIQNVTDYQRRYLQTATLGLDRISQGMNTLSESFGIKQSKLVELENIYAQIDPADASAKKRAYDDIVNYLGSLNSNATKKKAGDLYLGINDLFAGKRVADLVKTENGQLVKWSPDEQVAAQQIQDNFFKLRSDMTKVALNALRFQKINAAKIDKIEGGRRNLTGFLDQIEGMIKQLELTSSTPTGMRPVGEISGMDAKELYLDPNEKWFQVREEGYVPHHLLRVVEFLGEFDSYMNHNTVFDAEGNKRITSNSSQVEFKDMIDYYLKNGTPANMKARRTGIEEYYSRNPLFFLHKYVTDITKFNHDESMFSVLSGTMEALNRTNDYNNNKHKDPKIDDTLRHVYKMIERLNADSYIFSNAETVKEFYKGYLARGAQAMGYMRALSMNLRSGVKNWAGAHFNSVVEYGSQHFDTFNKERQNFLADENNGEMVKSALVKYGHVWAKEDHGFVSMINKYTRSLRGKSSISPSAGAMVGGGAATRGTFEENFSVAGLRQVKMEGGKLGYEFKDDNAADKFVSFLENTASATSGVQQMVENAVRPAVFKKAFAESYMNLNRLTQDQLLFKMNKDISQYTDINKAIDYKKLQKDAQAFKEDFAGRIAQAAVRATQYDYGRVSKADVMKKQLSGTILQFQHYRMENAAWQYNIYKEGVRQLRAAKQTGEFSRLNSMQVRRLFRLGMAQPLIHWMTTASTLGISNVVGNEIFMAIRDHFSLFMADPTTEEGQKQIAQATYNLGAATNLGITFSTIDNASRLLGLIEDDPNGKLYRGKFTGKLDPVDFSDDDNKRAALGLFNLQASRLAMKTMPDFISGNIWRALKYESGLYTNYDTRKANQEMMRPIAQVYQDWTGIDVPLLSRGRAKGPQYPGKYGTDWRGKRRRSKINLSGDRKKVKKRLSPFADNNNTNNRKLSRSQQLDALESLNMLG